MLFVSADTTAIVTHGRSDLMDLYSDGVYIESRFPNEAADPMSAFRRMAIGQDGGYWITRFDRYDVSRFSRTGGFIERATASLDWFLPPEQRHTSGVGTAGIVDIAVAGRILLLIQRARPAFRALADGASVPDRTVETVIRDWEFLIEVLSTGPIARHASVSLGERAVGGFLSATEVYTYGEDRSGAVWIDVWRVRIE